MFHTLLTDCPNCAEPHEIKHNLKNLLKRTEIRCPCGQFFAVQSHLTFSLEIQSSMKGTVEQNTPEVVR